MPELPEVETVVRELRHKLKNGQIKSAQINHPKIIKAPNKGSFNKKIRGQKIVDVRRRGKLIIIDLSSGGHLLVHLKMTGQLVFNQKQPTKHTHVILKLAGGDELHYNDIRKFGFWELVTPEGLAKVLNERFRFGPEPLSKDFTPEALASSLKKRQIAIKAALLNQSIVAGIGNIYADEALFRAKVNPRKRAGKLTNEEIKKLYNSIREVLTEAIRSGGSSSNNYVRTTGQKGSFQKRHNIYRKTGLPCPNCGEPIERIVIGGRSTHFCPNCQK